METQKNDIVPELYERIHKDFRSRIAINPWIRAFRKKLKAGTATQKAASHYAMLIGRSAGEALANGLTEDNLPDGKIYWNIAKRTIEPILRESTDMVNDAMVSIIDVMHKRKRIGIKPQRAEFNQGRCDAIMSKIVNLSLLEDDDE
ncbi:hypothetical protein [Hornefia butyriciproducens]|uniref:hypothetical protein n=1 Tax=Hornefia butyriciproducens TaxID=2652293 RepID=UPI0023F027DE|nr:hypothetical protein [Hornefia butyriciproducens]MDD6299441.1 hypothetical protein [Hornefia butyriciproducens]